jgi:hypothetical protein
MDDNLRRGIDMKWKLEARASGYILHGEVIQQVTYYVVEDREEGESLFSTIDQQAATLAVLSHNNEVDKLLASYQSMAEDRLLSHIVMSK